MPPYTPFIQQISTFLLIMENQGMAKINHLHTIGNAPFLAKGLIYANHLQLYSLFK